MSVSTDLYATARSLIPGGTQLLSKRPEMFLPDAWPAYYKSAKGCAVVDLDNNHYIDMSYMGIGSCMLGYADEDVDAAVMAAIQGGVMCTLNCPEEVELAQRLVDIHPFADMVRYSRTGGEAMAMAVRIARAYTRRDVVLFCGYHGWHDWYLSANLGDEAALDGHLLPGLDPTGVPRGLKGSARAFYYNDPDALRALAKETAGTAGVLVMEAIRSEPPTDAFKAAIEDVRKEHGLILIIDEITSGFRMTFGGAHAMFDMVPDIAVYAKGVSNGYPMAAVVGTKEVMEAAQSTFISSTYWTDRVGPTAALATINKMERIGAADRLATAGRRVKEGWRRLSTKHDLNLHVGGLDPLAHFGFHEHPLENKTVFTQEMLKAGYLANTSFYASTAHTDAIIDTYLGTADTVFAKLAAVDDPSTLLEGPVCHSGFKRLTS